jgi:hypothetical protein
MARQTTRSPKSDRDGARLGGDITGSLSLDRLEEYLLPRIVAAVIVQQGRQPRQRWVCHWSLSLARRMAVEVRARRAPGGLWSDAPRRRRTT